MRTRHFLAKGSALVGTLILALVICLAMLPGTARAQTERNGLTLSSDSGWSTVVDEDNIEWTVLIVSSGDLTISGEGEQIRVVLAKGYRGTITLDDVTIDASDTRSAAFVASGATGATIDLEGENTLLSGASHAGLEYGMALDAGNALEASTMAMGGTGSLLAVGGTGGAGIGGSANQASMPISIAGGTISARGGAGGAGIGGGINETTPDDLSRLAAPVTIGGGSVRVVAGSDAARIGSGSYLSADGTGVTCLEVTPTDGEGDGVFCVKLDDQESPAAVKVAGTDWGVGAGHLDDDALYLWLEQGEYSGDGAVRVTRDEASDVVPDEGASTYAYELRVEDDASHTVTRLVQDADTTLDQTTLAYDGTEQCPTVTCSWGHLQLEQDVDFCVTYESNVEKGDGATATVGTLEGAVVQTDRNATSATAFAYEGTPRTFTIADVATAKAASAGTAAEESSSVIGAAEESSTAAAEVSLSNSSRDADDASSTKSDTASAGDSATLEAQSDGSSKSSDASAADKDSGLTSSGQGSSSSGGSGSTQAQNSWVSSPSMQNWNEGDEASSPTAEAAYGTVRFSYASSPDGPWHDERPTGAGVWYLKAEVEETDAYEGLSSVVPFTVTRNPLARAMVTTKEYLASMGDSRVLAATTALVGALGMTFVLGGACVRRHARRRTEAAGVVLGRGQGMAPRQGSPARCPQTPASLQSGAYRAGNRQQVGIVRADARPRPHAGAQQQKTQNASGRQ